MAMLRAMSVRVDVQGGATVGLRPNCFSFVGVGSDCQKSQARHLGHSQPERFAVTALAAGMSHRRRGGSGLQNWDPPLCLWMWHVPLPMTSPPSQSKPFLCSASPTQKCPLLLPSPSPHPTWCTYPCQLAQGLDPGPAGQFMPLCQHCQQSSQHKCLLRHT